MCVCVCSRRPKLNARVDCLGFFCSPSDLNQWYCIPIYTDFQTCNMDHIWNVFTKANSCANQIRANAEERDGMRKNTRGNQLCFWSETDWTNPNSIRNPYSTQDQQRSVFVFRCACTRPVHDEVIWFPSAHGLFKKTVHQNDYTNRGKFAV